MQFKDGRVVFIFYDVNKPHFKLDWEVNEISTNAWAAAVNLLLLSVTRYK